MRIFLNLEAKRNTLIDFNYQVYLTGVLHKWIGPNNLEHGNVSLYSFSWLQNVESNKNGIRLKEGSHLFISIHDETLAKHVLKGIIDDPTLFAGIETHDVQIVATPTFSTRQTFYAASPIFVKRLDEQTRKQVHYTYKDEICNAYLTETLIYKLDQAGIDSTGVSVKFNETYPGAQVKLIQYNRINNKASICPVIIEGTAEQIGFAWNVGLGNSTGIGFGALK